MQSPKHIDRGAGPGVVRRPHRTAMIVAIAAALTAIFAVSQSSTPSQYSTPPPPGLRADKIDLPTPINQPPDANMQMEMREQLAKRQDFAAANTERRKQIADDSTRLLKLATELKAEVDKTTKDTLSLTVIRKADEIERLARGIKEKMKLSAGAS